MEPGAEAEPEGEDAGDRTLDSVRENRGSGGKAPRCETEKRVRSIVNSHVRAPLPRVSGAHPRRRGPVHTPGRFPLSARPRPRDAMEYGARSSTAAVRADPRLLAIS